MRALCRLPRAYRFGYLRPPNDSGITWQRLYAGAIRSPAVPVSIALSSLEARRLPIKTYTTADGLARDRVERVVPDNRGFLWIVPLGSGFDWRVHKIPLIRRRHPVLTTAALWRRTSTQTAITMTAPITTVCQ